MAKYKKLSYQFSTRLGESMYGTFHYAATILPKKIADQLPPGRLRTKGTLNEIPFALAIQKKKDGQRYFLFSRSICKEAGVTPGQSVDICFNLVDPDLLELPEELEAVLEQDDAAKKVWESFTTGRRRSLSLYVTSVKNVDSRIQRSLEMASKMKAGLLHVQRSQRSKNV